jgi:hypothetical protein
MAVNRKQGELKLEKFSGIGAGGEQSISNELNSIKDFRLNSDNQLVIRDKVEVEYTVNTPEVLEDTLDLAFDVGEFEGQLTTGTNTVTLQPMFTLGDDVDTERTNLQVTDVWGSSMVGFTYTGALNSFVISINKIGSPTALYLNIYSGTTRVYYTSSTPSTGLNTYSPGLASGTYTILFGMESGGDASNKYQLFQVEGSTGVTATSQLTYLAQSIDTSFNFTVYGVYEIAEYFDYALFNGQTLTSVSLYIHSIIGSPPPLYITLWNETDGNAIRNGITGTPTTAGWYTFDFPATAIPSNKAINIRVGTNGAGNGSNYWKVGSSTTGVYSGGVLCTTSDLWASALSTAKDLAFKLNYYDDSVMPTLTTHSYGFNWYTSTTQYDCYSTTHMFGFIVNSPGYLDKIYIPIFSPPSVDVTVDIMNASGTTVLKTITATKTSLYILATLNYYYDGNVLLRVSVPSGDSGNKLTISTWATGSGATSVYSTTTGWGNRSLVSGKYLIYILETNEVTDEVISNNAFVTYTQQIALTDTDTELTLDLDLTTDGSTWYSMSFYDTDDALLETTYLDSFIIPPTATYVIVTIFHQQFEPEDTTTLTVNSLSLSQQFYFRGIYRDDDSFLVVINKQLYTVSDTYTLTSKFTFDNDANTQFIKFTDIIYMLNGYQYVQYDPATDTAVEVVGYIPIIWTNGSFEENLGDPYEQINLLTDWRWAEYTSTESDNSIVLPEINLLEVEVYDRTTLLERTVDYNISFSADRYGSTVTFIGDYAIPPAGTNRYRIKYKVSNTYPASQGVDGTERATVEDMTNAIIYGGNATSRLILYGKGAKIIWSSLDIDGNPRGDYFAPLSFNSLGPGEDIVSITKQFDKIKIFFRNSAMYAYFQELDGIVTYPAFELHPYIGSYVRTVAMDNYIFSASKGLNLWELSTSSDNTGVIHISEPIDEILGNVVKLYNNTFRSEIFIITDTTVYVYNYLKRAYYEYTIPIPSHLAVHLDTLYYTHKNILYSMHEDNTEVVEGEIETHWIDFNTTDKKGIKHVIITNLAACDNTLTVTTPNDEYSITQDGALGSDYFDLCFSFEELYKFKIASTGAIDKIVIPYTVQRKVR